ncbi:hypothetical protein GCM10007858_42200 [Bradyrhizobium liaoningense]|nr:hypothetical protein GCM10007858_42200 [Bradyrhizobium liaoningense]
MTPIGRALSAADAHPVYNRAGRAHHGCDDWRRDGRTGSDNRAIGTGASRTNHTASADDSISLSRNTERGQDQQQGSAYLGHVP